jgi:predicted secreted protein
MNLRSATLAILLLATAPALAAEPADSRTEIQLTQQAARTVPHDRLRTVLRVEVQGATGPQVQGEINRRMTAALARAKEATAIKAETGGYSVGRIYDPKAPQPWQGSQTLSLTSADFNAVLALAGELQNNGLLMSGLQFFLAPEKLGALQDEMTTEALAALKTRAANVARDLGMAVEGYKAVMVGNAETGFSPQPRMAMMSAAKSAPPPVAEAGDATVTLTVNATVLLKRP